MKRTISFEKKIEFPSMIGEITSISLEHTLKFIDPSNIEGDFIVSGTYKLTEASRIEEEFNYRLPAEIIIGERLDETTSKVDIEDFYYEIENDYSLICYIDVKIEGVELVELEDETPSIENTTVEETLTDIETLEEHKLKIDDIEKKEESLSTRECDGDILEDQSVVEEVQEIQEMETVEMTETKEKQVVVSSLFENINESEETYSTYSVYILREEETVNSLIEKYKTTKEELESYNDLTTLTVGSKIIIPLHEE